MPIKEQIFGQKWSYNHSGPIMHETSCIEFSHACINYGKTSSTLFPCIKLLLIVSPFDIIEFGLEWVILFCEYSREVVSYIDIEISPMYLIYYVILHS